MSFSIEPYSYIYRDQIIHVWERSVRATHHFLNESDIIYYKSMVDNIDFSEFNLYCYFTDSRELAGFLGVDGHKLEMLFLSPEFIGQGIGKTLIEFAKWELHINEVDVNEDNTSAVAFYKNQGFKVYGKTIKDSVGKPYPILKMKLDME
jgi:putative acetyltransferase